MKKLNVFTLAVLSGVLLVNSATFAGEAKRISKSLPVPKGKTADINAFKLKLIAAEKASKTISEYRSREKSIIANFKNLRRAKLSKLRANEVIQCKVYAKKPKPTRGRKSDSCSISNDSSYFRGWVIVSANDRRLDTYNGGQPKGDSVQKNNRVTLSLTCRSPKWRDTTTGRCQLTKQTVITYKPSNKYISDSINQEIGLLLSR